ncbi:MAG: glycine cleavage T C-terminal barrel domain-containing protein [Cypionkella sp.]
MWPATSVGIYAAVITAGARPYGIFALNTLRLEKGYRSWKGHMYSDYSKLEAGLRRFVKWSKPDFIGKAALKAERQAGSRKRFLTLILDAWDCDAPDMSSIRHQGAVVGETISSGYGYRVGALIALVMVRADLAAPGTALVVEIFGQRMAAVVQPDEPLWDPANEHLRA